MKNIEEDLIQWAAISKHSGADQIYISLEVAESIIERIYNLKDEIQNQKNRADFNFEVANFYDQIANKWFIRSNELEEIIVDLTDEIL